MSSIEEYGANFCFPAKDLESDRVKLTPFLPSKHADAFYAIPRPSYDYLPFGPFDTVDEFISDFLEARIHAEQSCMLFAVYDKTKASETGKADGALAGAIGFCNASASNLAAEIAFVLISPKFQRTHVTSNAIGLLLHYALDLPEAGGLALRRVVWQASPLNEPSLKAAERMGFKREGYLRWVYVMPEGKPIGNGRERRAGDPKPHLLGRDAIILSLCWDDWENGARRRVDAIMARTA
ncbi:putative acetyltransferase (GNAT) domain containing protein [Lyophyllum shimeji]|uniref:Acetyltransferase (GNAT) domain containing protein n=1 Tax=Lyophyllum shimeji TaxID=47721 RepID=A0A9P3PWA5_LYOSH|nr:putative acetyltransferase (GNAT) domain containing protein [Lyophyllum shimeji]